MSSKPVVPREVQSRHCAWENIFSIMTSYIFDYNKCMPGNLWNDQDGAKGTFFPSSTFTDPLREKIVCLKVGSKGQ